MRQTLVCILALVACTAAPAATMAQGIPTGSTKVVGPPDSAFSSFLAFLKSQGGSVIRTDSVHQRVEARVKGSEEPIVFAFTAEGDSTAVNAQGTKGGMNTLIFGLGVVDNWLKNRRAHAAPARKP